MVNGAVGDRRTPVDIAADVGDLPRIANATAQMRAQMPAQHRCEHTHMPTHMPAHAST